MPEVEKTPTLEQLIEEARKHPPTEKELREQTVSYVHGINMESGRTIEEVRRNLEYPFETLEQWRKANQHLGNDDSSNKPAAIRPILPLQGHLPEEDQDH